MWRRHLLCSVLLALACATMASPTTTDNDDSCDISVLPAATLLLPYFDVDLSTRNGEDTLFTITNVARDPQIAHVTLWTDLAYPIFTFNIFLTGYDTQSISLYDVIVSGLVAPPFGTSSGSDVGGRSAENDENPLLDIGACDDSAVTIPSAVIENMRAALTTGLIEVCGNARVGNVQGDGQARGYITVDVVNRCSTTLPTDARYYAKELLYENVLIGDYQQVDGLNNFAQGGTVVHIRAVPEGGGPGSLRTDLDRTFYSRYQDGRTTDRRQPLPSTFAARWISGGPGALDTRYKIWREGVTSSTGCDVRANRTKVTEFVRFDEEENPTVFRPDVIFDPVPDLSITLPAVSHVNASDTSIFPPNPGGDLGGWMYMNLDGEQPVDDIDTAGQNWVIVSMEAEGRFSTEFDAVALGNGCSPAAPITAEDGSLPVIAPAANVISTEARVAPSTINNDDSCDIGALPAATLLLPYFEIDLDNQQRASTLFTITNVTQLPQIARVTIWTDRSYPLVDFPVFLTGYDVQAIDLFDVIGYGIIAPPLGTTSDNDEGERSLDNDENPLLDISGCDRLPVNIPRPVLDQIRAGLTTGLIGACGPARVGNLQPDRHARGYVTIDIVRTCEPNFLPTDPRYFTNDILFDNVLIGDYHQVDRSNNFAQGGSMVHIRAVPEGGAPRAKTTALDRTFYGRYQRGGTADRRQPLPSTFAAHWISGGPGALATSFKIWRDGLTGPDAGCDVEMNTANTVTEFVRFDEDENPSTSGPVSLGSASQVSATETAVFPPNPGGDLAGWMYMNLDNKSDAGGEAATQGWVVVSMAAEGRFSVDFDAAALGNGCSTPAPQTAGDGLEPSIGPAP